MNIFLLLAILINLGIACNGVGTSCSKNEDCCVNPCSPTSCFEGTCIGSYCKGNAITCQLDCECCSGYCDYDIDNIPRCNTPSLNLKNNSLIISSSPQAQNMLECNGATCGSGGDGCVCNICCPPGESAYCNDSCYCHCETSSMFKLNNTSLTQISEQSCFASCFNETFCSVLCNSTSKAVCNEETCSCNCVLKTFISSQPSPSVLLILFPVFACVAIMVLITITIFVLRKKRSNYQTLV